MELRTSHETGWSATEASGGRKPWTARVVLLLSSVMMTVLALVGVAVTAAPAATTGLVSLPQSVAPQVAAAQNQGATSASQSLSLAISLRSRNQAGLQDYATQVAQPKSKLYHQYLTPAQFASAFGADPAALNSVEKYLQTQGLHLNAAQSGGLFLTFSGTVSQVESAFHTHINNYKAADGRSVYANADALQVPAALAPSIMDVAGTENIRVEQPSTVASPKQTKAVTSHVVTCAVTPTLTASTVAAYNGLLPSQVAKAYNMTGTLPGTGVWAALIESDGFSGADLNQYASCFLNASQQAAIAATPGTSYSSSSLIQIRNPGLSSAITPGANALGVESEIETLLGLTPNLLHLTVVETAATAMGTQMALADIANNNGPQVIGDQWGMCESDVGFPNAQAEEQLFMQMALQGQTVFAATGNNGLYACNGDGKNFQNNGFGVMDPASDPFVTAVGGSELAVATGAAPVSVTGWGAEQPWSDANAGSPAAAHNAGGGGVSQFWAAQPWQTTNKAAYVTANDANNGNGTTGTQANVGVKAIYNQGSVQSNNVAGRTVPDVAADADATNSSVAVYCSVGSACSSGATTFTNVGGTGIANAIWVAAGVQAAQAASPAAPAMGGRLGIIAPALYNVYGADLLTAGAGKNVAGTNGKNYCDYIYQLGITNNATPSAAGTALSTFRYTGGTCDGDVLNQPEPIVAAAASYTTLFPATAGFQQPASVTSIGGSSAGYAVNSNGVLTTLMSGYNAATGLGSPNVGVISSSTTGLNLAGYLSNVKTQALPRAYLFAQASSDGTYWVGSYGLNPYVQNMPTNTQWFQLSKTISFTGAPTVVDDSLANGGTAKNIYIFGPTNATTTTVGIIDWNVQTQTATQVTQTVAGAPGATAGNTSCTNVSTFVNNAGTIAGVYCVTSTGNLYSNSVTLATGVYGAAAWTGPILTNVSGQPAIAKGSGDNFEVVLQNVGSNNLQYTPSTLSFATATGATPFSAPALSTLLTTCNSTPALSFIPQLTSYAASCTAADTKNMWANTFNPTNALSKWSSWQLLGQPSPSVTFMPGAAVAVDNVANDPGYGLVFYIAEGSDKGMYLNAINTNTTSFLGKISGWQSISLPGIFNSNSAADFANS